LFATAATDLGAQSAGVQSLRGQTPIASENETPDTYRQNNQGGSLGRAYRQQPPLIPHRIDGYQVNLKNNQCMNCHDWPNNVESGAPKISETHYVSRNGIRLDELSRNRWFCSQCHVPQANARALVDNTFKNSTQVD